MRNRNSMAMALSIALALSLCACGQAGNQAGGTETAASQTEDGGKASDTSEAAETGTSAEESTEALGEGSGDTYLLAGEMFSKLFYVVDGKGKVLRSYDREVLKKGAEKAGFLTDHTSIYTADESYEQCYILDADTDFAFFEETDNDIRYVYAVNADTCKVYELSNTGEDRYIQGAECYNGRLYLKTVGSSDNTQEEYYYEYDEATDSFSENSAGLETLFKTANDKGYSLDSGISGSFTGREISITHTLDKYGCVLGRNGGDYSMFTPDGRDVPVNTQTDSFIYVWGYDSDRMFFTVYDDDEGQDILYECDIYSGKVTRLKEDDAPSRLGYYDGLLYYYTTEEKEYGKKKNSVYSYDPESSDEELLYESDSVPGVSEALGIDGFRAIGGDCYCLAYTDGEAVRWARVKPSGGPAKYEDIDCPDREITAFKYGTVVGDSHEEKCPNCGTPLLKEYGERFILNRSVSDKADLINEDLEKKQEFFLSPTEEDKEYQSDPSDCEEHKKHPEQYCITNDLRVSNVHIINEKYLTVDVDGYWYGGGAHGTPNRNQYMYDLKTGNQVSIKDLYPATEEVFKALVAECTVKNMESYDPDESPYFSSDSTELYKQAYDEASLETTFVEFKDDGANIVYSPYDMGAYAAGYIEVPVSYMQLLGRNTL